MHRRYTSFNFPVRSSACGRDVHSRELGNTPDCLTHLFCLSGCLLPWGWGQPRHAAGQGVCESCVWLVSGQAQSSGSPPTPAQGWLHRSSFALRRLAGFCTLNYLAFMNLWTVSFAGVTIDIIRWRKKGFWKVLLGDTPGGPVCRTLSFQCRDPGLVPSWETR